MVEQKRIIFLCGPRTGSTWVQHGLVANIEQTHVVTHGLFNRRPEDALRQWREDKSEFIIAIGDHWLAPMLPFKPEIAFLWRNPLDMLASFVARIPRYKSVLPLRRQEREAKRYAFRLFNDAEGALALAEAAGIEPRHWNFDSYKTEKGLRELAAAYGMRLKPNLTIRGNAKNPTPENCRIDPATWGPPTHKFISDLLRSLPRVSAAWEGNQVKYKE